MRPLLFLALFALISAPLFAQSSGSHFPARRPGWVTLGIDGGLAFQTADVCPQFNGRGGGLTIAKNLAYRPGGALSLDLRGRFLLTRSYGLDTKRSYGILNNRLLTEGPAGYGYLNDISAPYDSSYVYQNYRNGMGELGLEGVLTFNRLRERTGVVLSLFGGVGLDFYRTKLDQFKANGDPYDYAEIDPAATKTSIKSALNALRDGDYETTPEGLRARLMPGAGIELGYQITPRFMIGVGHKLTFSGTDLLDGQEWTDLNVRTGGNDLHHYTSINLRWDLVRKDHKVQPPVIEIIEPQGNPYVTRNASETLRARVRNVRNYADVQCYLNGDNQPYNLDNEQLRSKLQLRPGRNEVLIVASNPAGKDEARLVIVFEDHNTVPDPPAPRRPEVRIVEPARSPLNTDRPEIGVVADVRNVKETRDIRFLVNGVSERFSLAENLEGSARLREGRNLIRVEASNAAGSASDEIEVFFRREEPQGPKPLVAITQPRGRNELSSDPLYNLLARVEHVDSRDDIVLYFNGNTQREFSFDARSGRLSADLRLRRGDNDVTLRARNRFGEGDASVTITLKDKIVEPPARRPEVRITAPNNGETVNKPETELRATLKNVANRDQLVLIENGIAVRTFDFNASAQTLRASLTLRVGENTLTVRATNADGSDEATVKLRYEAPKPKPNVRITEPAGLLTTTTKPTATVKALTENVASRNEITCELNKKSVPFNFDAARSAISFEAALQPGDNAVVIKVNNAGGGNQASCTIRYDAPKKPEIAIDTPENNAETKDAVGELSARTVNVSTQSQLSVYLNGKPIPFSFDPARRRIVARLNFAEGQNTVRVNAQTEGGNAEVSASVRYIKPKPPVVTISEPKDQSTTDQNKIKLTAKVENILGKDNVKLWINKSAVPDFNLDRAGNLTADLTLNEGPNAVLITANTPDGNGQATVTVQYAPKAPPAKPEISFTQPGRPGSGAKASLYEVKATVKGVDSKEKIKFWVNGELARSFAYDGRTKTLVAQVLLKNGKNVFKIEASNAAGTSSAQTDVTFNAKTAPEPEVVIESVGQPVTSPFNPNAASTLLLVGVKNVTKKEQISIKVNDQPVTAFDFNAETGKVTASIPIKRGSNPVLVRVETEGGSAEAKTSVKFE